MAADSPKTTKRRLRAPTQTVRQKAEKAQASADKPEKRRVRAATAARKPFARIGRVFKRQPFRFIGKIVAPKFVRNAFYELKLVDWPDRKTTRQLTFAVLAFALVFGVTVGLVDYGLNALFKEILLK